MPIQAGSSSSCVSNQSSRVQAASAASSAAARSAAGMRPVRLGAVTLKDGPSRDRDGSGIVSVELDQRSPSGEPDVELVPPVDVALAEPPAQPDLAAGHERGEVDQAGVDVAQA